MTPMEQVEQRAREVWAPRVAQDWLNSPCSYLEGARPADVVLLRGAAGAAEVLAALEQIAQGAFA